MHSRFRVSLLLAALFTSGPARADFVVLQSESGDFTVGQLLAEGEPLSLLENESLVLLSDDGNVVELAGPYDGAPAGSSGKDVDVRHALSHLIDRADTLYATLGSTRGINATNATSPDRDVWLLDPFLTGHQCALNDRAPRFWRPGTEEALELVVQRPGHTGDGVLAFETGQPIADWPEAIPLVNGELYVIRRRGYLDNAMIRLIVLDAGLGENTATAVAWLAISGCSQQARNLLQHLD